MVAGLIAALVTSPVDLVKTRVMNQTKQGGVLRYSSSWDCVKKVSGTNRICLLELKANGEPSMIDCCGGRGAGII